MEQVGRSVALLCLATIAERQSPPDRDGVRPLGACSSWDVAVECSEKKGSGTGRTLEPYYREGGTFPCLRATTRDRNDLRTKAATSPAPLAVEQVTWPPSRSKTDSNSMAHCCAPVTPAIMALAADASSR